MPDFPKQDIPELKKDLTWAKGHFLYAEDLLKQNIDRASKFNKLYNTYNGVVNSRSVEYLTATYGKYNRSKYVSYRLSKTKIDLVNNEWLLRPLNSTVTTTNILSKTAKLDQYETVLGAAHAKEPIEKLRGVGVDPLDGMAVPDINDESFWSQMSFKDKNESVMQVLINSSIKDMDLKEKFNKNFQDVLITGMCFGQNIVDINGNDDYNAYQPNDAIFVEIQGDTFLQKTPIIGHREAMTYHDILRKFSFTKEERAELEAMRNNVTRDFTNSAYRGRYGKMGGELTIDVIHIEWKSLRPSYYKNSPLSKSQASVAAPDDSYRVEISPEYYEKNKEKIDKEVSAGKYELETKWQEELWEGWQIGHNIYKDVRRKPFTMRLEDEPGKVYGYSYTGLLANTVNGYRISMQELMQAFSDAYDIVKYQMMREVGKVKGKSIVYDSAALPRKTTIKDVLYQLANDNFININTSAAGNMSNRDIANALGIKEVDLGLSQSFPALVALAQEIKMSLDMISGLNADRAGFTAASSTATNAQSNISNSRTITEGWFFLMSLYVEKVFMKIAQQRKLIWGLYKPEKARIILGDEKFGFMQATRDLAYCDYGVHLVDGSRENDLRRKIFMLAEASLNTKELRYQDVMEMEMAETVSDAIAVLKKAWKEIQKNSADMAARSDQAKMAMIKAQMENDLKIAQEDREDRQEASLVEIDAKADAQIRVDNNKGRGQLIIDQSKHEQEQFVTGE